MTARLALGTFCRGAVLGCLALHLGSAAAIERHGFIAPGAEAYVADLQFGSYGALNDEMIGPQAVAVEGSGNVWVADAGNHRVSRFSADGVFQFSFGGYGSGDGQFNGPRGIAVDSQRGTLWVADTYNNRVQKFDFSGHFLCKNTTLNRPEGVAVRPLNGYVYVANTGADSVARMSSSCTPNGGWGGTGSIDGTFVDPTDVAVEANGNVLVTDHGNDRVQRFTPTGTFVAGFGVTGSGDSRFAASPQFSGPTGIEVDAAGDVYVADYYNDRIQKFRKDFTLVADWGWSGAGAGQFDNPYGIAVDGQGRLYVADRDNNRVQRFKPSATAVTWLLRNQWGSDGAGNGQFYHPIGIGVRASTGHVYVVDNGNNRVQEFDGAGAYVGKWGTYGTGNGQFRGAGYLAVDQATGDVYVTEDTNQRVQKFTSAGVYVTKWGSAGTANGNFNGPQGVAVDPVSHDVYVADYDNQRVQRFTGAGAFVMGIGNGTTWTGAAPVPGSGNRNGQFNGPLGVAVNAAGELFVTEYGNDRVQRFDATGAFVTRFGNGGSGHGQYASPAGIVADDSGDVDVIDTGNHRVQQLQGDGRFLTAWSSYGALPGQQSSPSSAALSADGDVLYVTDTYNHRVQAFERFGFGMAASVASRTVTAGQNAGFPLNFTGVGPNSTAQKLTLAVLSGLPAGATSSFSAQNLQPAQGSTVKSALTVRTTASTPAGTYRIVVGAVGGGQTRVRTLTLVVNPP